MGRRNAWLSPVCATMLRRRHEVAKMLLLSPVLVEANRVRPTTPPWGDVPAEAKLSVKKTD